MNTSQIRIQKTSRLLSIGLRILYIFLFAAIALQIGAIVWLFVTAQGDSASSLAHVQLLAPISEAIDCTVAEFVAQMCANILTQGLIIAMLMLAVKIFKEISRDYSPFTTKHVSRLKAISLLMFAMAIIPPPIQMLLTQLLAPNVEASASFNLMNLVFVVVFYCLAQIFDYGRLLQQESDETL